MRFKNLKNFFFHILYYNYSKKVILFKIAFNLKKIMLQKTNNSYKNFYINN